MMSIRDSDDTHAGSLVSLLLLLPLIVFTEGFVSVAIEILAIRQLLPVAGSSIIVTSLVIGIFLLFLALGYRKGGSLQGGLTKRLRLNFLVASLWLGIGLSYVFVFLFFQFVERWISPHISYPLVAYLLLIIAPLIYILGQTIPIAMHVVKQQKSAGKIGGDTLSLSTIGSFLGATVTSLIFMHYVGVAWTVFINFFLLLVLGLLLTENKISLFSHLFFAGCMTLMVYTLNVQLEKNMFILTNNYANYALADAHNAHLPSDEKIFVINNLASSFTNHEKHGFEYIEKIKQILFHDLKLQGADILVLGAGGFSLSAENTYHNRFTYVDVDGQIKRVAIPRFLSSLQGQFIADDARHYLHSTKNQYQAIVVDTYGNTKAFPQHLLTQEYMAEVKRRLTDNGVVIFNIIAKPALADPYSKRMDNTVRSVFKNCMVIPLNYGMTDTNILYVCRNVGNEREQVVYLDNKNSSSTDSFEW